MSRYKKIGGKYSGIYINSLENGDESYAISYRDEQQKIKRKVIGKKSEGMTKTKALTELNDVKIKIKKREPSQLQASTKTLNELAMKYFDDKEIEGKSVLKDKSKYKKVINLRWADKEARNIVPKEIQSLILSMRAEVLKDSTIKKLFDLCRAIVNHAIKKKYYYGINVFEGVEIDVEDNTRTRFLSHEEVDRLLNALSNYDNGQKNFSTDTIYTLGILALNTGARKETLFHIKYKDINFKTGVIQLYNFKRKKYFQGILADEEILEYLHNKSFSENRNSYILQGKNGNKLSTIPRPFVNVLNSLFNFGIESKALDKVVFHSLRHTFGSLLVQDSVPIFTVKKLMDHEKIESTMRYAKLAPDNGLIDVKKLWKKQSKL